MLDELGTECRGLFDVLSHHLPWELRKQRKSSANLAGTKDRIQTEHFPDGIQSVTAMLTHRKLRRNKSASSIDIKC
jgi:hypothetical protein